MKLTLKLGLIFEFCRMTPTVQPCLHWYPCHILKLLDPRSQGYVLPIPWKQFSMEPLTLNHTITHLFTDLSLDLLL